MKIKANNLKDAPHAGNYLESVVEQKLDEVAAILEGQQLDDETLEHLRKKFDTTLQSCSAGQKAIEAFRVIDAKADASREELLDEFTMLLLSNKVDSKTTGKYLRAKKANNLLLMLIALVMVTLGLAMIVIPAPPYFEMFTIYYFTEEDGITLMDVISCIIILVGLYILIRTLYKGPFADVNHE